MKKPVIILILSLSAGFSTAQDRVFCRTYQSNILPSGVMELEYWNTVRSGRSDYYNAIDQRLELELGVGKNVMTAFYLNFSTSSFATEIPGEVPYKEIINEQSMGFSNEWKVKLADPVANKVGFALYGEAGFDSHEFELEGKLIFDKQVERNIFALNLTGEYEISYSAEGTEITTESETPVELTGGYMRLAGKSAGIGFEIRNHNEIEEGEWENSAWFAGPSFHFRGDRWFINFNAMPQLFNAKKEQGDDSTRDLDDHEKAEFRLLLSFSF